jgi:flagellar biosynthesis protein FlhA
MAQTAEQARNDRRLLNSNVLAALIMVAVLGLMVIPVATPLLDILLTFNIALAMTVFLVTVYLRRPMDFSVFPALLLMVTLFRLALNVASTRVILSEGSAGEVIEAFGNFVVGGNFVIGVVVFLILVVVQFVVITKGSGRIAEVAARFTLDALPGKQMSIDADLNAGLINEDQARTRRKEIADEAEFFGSMDGASKFVRGDAIAGIVITVINILGGLVIGTLQRGMPLEQAFKTYTLLTVGDGLVSQIPALLVSTAAGIVVTRNSGGVSLGFDISSQIVRDPRALLVSSAALAAFAFVPGLPTVPFVLLAAATGAAGLAARNDQDRRERTLEEETERAAREQETTTDDGPGDEMFVVDRLELEIGYGLIPLVDANRGGDLLGRITNVRRKTGSELGMSVAPIRIRDNLQLGPHEYQMKLRGVEIARFTMKLDRLLAMRVREGGPNVAGDPTTEPAFGLPALWIRKEDRSQAEISGYTVVEPSAVVATHLAEVVKSHADEILTRQDVQEMVDRLKEIAPALVGEVFGEKVSLTVLHGVLRGLLHERVPVRDLITILETLAASAPVNESQVDSLVERVRGALSRQLSHLHADAQRTIWALTVHPESEQALFASFRESERTQNVVMDPGFAERFVATLGQMVDQVVASGRAPLLVVSSPIRSFTRRLIEASFPSVAVLGYTEIAPGYQIRSLGTVIAHARSKQESTAALAHAAGQGR